MGFFIRDAYGRQVAVGALLRIGSHPSNQVVLQGPQVAPFHATLSEQSGGLLLRDENSPTGTLVNRQPVKGTVVLRAGDQVAIGSATFVVGQTPIQPGIPAAKPKKSVGCWKWGILGVVILVIACLVLGAGGGYYLYANSPDLQSLVADTGIIPTPVPELDASGHPIGPATLDLTDPALNALYTHSFRHFQQDSTDGFDKNDAPYKYVMSFETMQQDQPQWSDYGRSIEKSNGQTTKDIESSVIDGKSYSFSNLGNNPCAVRDDSFADQHELQVPNVNLKGRVKQVESGVTINGVLTDRYELTLAQVGVDATLELKSGSLYRARQGGYLVQIEYTVLIKPQSYGMNIGSKYSDDKPAWITFHDDYTYYPNGAMQVKVPAGCASQVPGGSAYPTSTP